MSAKIAAASNVPPSIVPAGAVSISKPLLRRVWRYSLSGFNFKGSRLYVFMFVYVVLLRYISWLEVDLMGEVKQNI